MSNQIQGLNSLLNNTLLVVNTYSWPHGRFTYILYVHPILFAVTCDIFVTIVFHRNNFLYTWSPDPLYLEIEGRG